MDTKDFKIVKTMGASDFESELSNAVGYFERQNLKVDVDYKPLINDKGQVIHLALVRAKG